MTNTLSIMPLDADWSYLYAENAGKKYAQIHNRPEWIPLPSLSDWSVVSSARFGADWFRREVTIEPLDTCVNYFLKIDHVPENAMIFVNGKLMGQVQSDNIDHLTFDVTNALSLGDNLIAIKLRCNSDSGGGSFENIRLQPVPCE